jgi:hypothetical protein
MWSLNLLASSERVRQLRADAAAARRPDDGEIPVTQVTLRYAAAADAPRLQELAELDSASVPQGPALVAEVDGRLRAALAIDGGAVIADPFHRSTELIELLRTRAAQLSAAT